MGKRVWCTYCSNLNPCSLMIGDNNNFLKVRLATYKQCAMVNTGIMEYISIM